MPYDPSFLKDTTPINLSISIVGDSGVGKRSLVLRAAHDYFYPDSLPDLGTDSQSISLEDSKENTKGNLKVYTTFPFRTLIHAVILVFDITNPESLDHLSFSLAECRKKCNENTLYLLVGTKCDLSSARKIQPAQIEEFKSQNPDIFKYLEVSAKENINIKEMFWSILREHTKAPTPTPEFQMPESRTNCSCNLL